MSTIKKIYGIRVCTVANPNGVVLHDKYDNEPFRTLEDAVAELRRIGLNMQSHGNWAAWAPDRLGMTVQSIDGGDVFKDSGGPTANYHVVEAPVPQPEWKRAGSH